MATVGVVVEGLVMKQILRLIEDLLGASLVIGLALTGLAAAFSWTVVLPTIGLLYLIGYLG